jgi:hypothetical protein
MRTARSLSRAELATVKSGSPKHRSIRRRQSQRVPGIREQRHDKHEERRGQTSDLSEYDKWAKKHPNDATMMGGFLFFRYLQNEKTELLDFRARDNDKWQIVHGWLRDWVKD